MSVPVFNPSNNLFSYFSCKVTTGTYNLQSAMLNFKSDGVLTQTAASCAGSFVASFCYIFTLSVNTQFCDNFIINSLKN